MMTDTHEDRKSALYGTLITFLLLNNLAVITRIYTHYRTYYRKGGWVFLEDIFLLLSGLLVNAVIGNLLASTYYGLGLHAERLVAEDGAQAPHNMAIVFKHVWVTMVLSSPTLTAIKLSLLFFYRRLFLVNQKWLRIAWWVNLVYVILWVFGATGFYLFQCWPVQWYWLQYYRRYHVQPPGGVQGQCNATTVQHVAMPLIFGLISDLGILLLPITAILRLHMSNSKKLGLAGIFSVGLLACLLEVARIVDLEVDTDDKTDPSYGVTVFLILTVAEEVCAIICSTLPVVIPQLFQAWKKHHSTHTDDTVANKPGGTLNASKSTTRGFKKLGEFGQDLGDVSLEESQGSLAELQQIDGHGQAVDAIPMNTAIAHTTCTHDEENRGDAGIVIKKEFEVTSSQAGTRAHAM